VVVSTRQPISLYPRGSELRSLLQGSGLRATPARLAVLRFLEAARRPVSHAELVKALGDKGIDRVTLYRNLTDLTQAHLVRRIDLGDHVWRFESRRNGDGHAQHPHFTCVECGESLCLPRAAVRVAVGKGVPRSAARSLEIQIRGVCDRCAADGARRPGRPPRVAGTSLPFRAPVHSTARSSTREVGGSFFSG
jgi:Fur family ferric uptake transcriptional regulator